MNMKKLWGTIAGALVGCVAYPLALLLTIGITVSGGGSIVLLLAPGIVIGGVLGFIFPRFFGAIADIFLIGG